MGFDRNIREDALVASGRHCCLCHRFCGMKIEVHHIKPVAEGGTDDIENAIPLCFDCHADMRSYDANHPKGTKYSEKELVRHRDNWIKRVSSAGGLVSQDPVPETDIKVFQKLLSTLPWEGSLHFIATNNFAGFSFKTNSLSELEFFLDLDSDPAFEFLDSDLESAKSELNFCINKFLRSIGQNTFPTSNMGFNHVPPEWEEKNPEQFNAVVAEIEELANQVVESYKALVRVGRQKLGVLPSWS